MNRFMKKLYKGSAFHAGASKAKASGAGAGTGFTRALMFVCLLMSCVMTVVSPVHATADVEYQDLRILVQMDKEQYEAGEPITATITAINVGSQTVTVVNLEQLIPEGYVLSEDSEVATQNVDVKPGQSIELKVTFEGDPAAAEENQGEGTFWDKVFYGETFGIPNLILVVALVFIFIVYMALT